MEQYLLNYSKASKFVNTEHSAYENFSKFLHKCHIHIELLSNKQHSKIMKCVHEKFIFSGLFCIVLFPINFIWS